MSQNLASFCRDACDIMRFRYQAIEHYRYSPFVFLAVMLCVGVVNAVMLTSLMGQQGNGILGFGIVIAVLKWLLLTRALTSVLHRFGSPRIPFLGYTLLTEALIIPMLILSYFPKAAPVLQAWYLWASWAQLLGFVKISQQTFGKVLLGYVVYYVVTLFFSVLMLQFFLSAGWLDAAEIEANLQKIIQMGT